MASIIIGIPFYFIIIIPFAYSIPFIIYKFLFAIIVNGLMKVFRIWNPRNIV